MVESSKHVFWQALVFTVIIFMFGFLMGFFLEISRGEKLEFNLMSSEINLLDEQIRGLVTNNFNVTCEIAIDSTFYFADKIYNEAVKLEKYDAAAKFTNSLIQIHKRYDLLRLLLWTEAIELKKRCGGEFHTVVYLYSYKIDDVNVNAEQSFFARMLRELKDKYTMEILLIPIAGNLDLESIKVVLAEYEIKELPVIIVDEKNVVEDVIKFEELENIVFKSNKE